MPRPGRRVGKKTTHNPNPNGRRGKEGAGGGAGGAVAVDESEEYSEDGEDEEVKVPSSKKRATDEDKNGNAKNGHDNKKPGDRGKDKSDKLDKSERDGEREWVQCDVCSKWRSLPATVDLSTLQDKIWTCEMNVYSAKYNNCNEPEEVYNSDVNLTNFFKHWSKRLKDSLRYTHTLENQNMYGSEAFAPRSRKRIQETEWIKCCNPSCGKWRSIMSGLNSTAMVSRLNKSKWTESKNSVWYCSMNSWDDATASCSAPQEPLSDLPWNLGLTK